LAAGRTSPDDVFINCPFDECYASLFQTLIFAVHACGFQPRSARESDDGGQARLEKLYDIIEECRYGIHDLSRTELDEANGLPRFNMPLELGIFLGCKRYGGEAQREKRLLILDTEQYRYQQFVSDLAGMDIHAHGGEPANILIETRNWLATASRRKLPSGPRLAAIYAQFLADLPSLAGSQGFAAGHIPHVDFVGMVAGWLVEATALD
jgi:hypothetical protein